MDLHALCTQINPNMTVITANRRQSAFVRHVYDQHQAKRGLKTWQSADVLPLNAWLARCWQQTSLAHPAKLLLNSAQNYALWQRVLTKQQALTNIQGLVKTVQGAWQLCQEWSINLPKTALTHEHAQLLHWFAEFQQQLDTEELQDPYQLANNNTHFDSLTPRELLLYGFDEITPQLQQLLTHLRKCAWSARLVNVQQEKTHCQQLAIDDEHNELITMARWAKQCWLDDDTQTIACVIPNLANIRDQVQRVFADVFMDQTITSYNISAGKPLADYPISVTALQILTLPKGVISYQLVSHLLRSPFIGEAESELNQRALLDVELRNLGQLEFSLAELYEETSQLCDQRHSHLACPHLLDRLQVILKSVAQLPEQQTAGAWANYFNQLLQQIGWPGERTLNSHEYQTVERWQQLLAELASMDQVSDVMDYETALSLLQTLAEQSLFQAASDDTPIQILGVLEGAGLMFDKLWLMGLHNTAWPAPAQPNPLIPISIQRELQLPHCSAERQLSFYTQLTRRFEHSAKQVIFSYPTQRQDEVLQPSQLITHHPELPYDELKLAGYTSSEQQLQRHAELEYLDDHTAPRLTKNQSRGGTQIFKRQAACPFQAYATIRLQAESVPEPEYGMTALERGSVVHAALDLIWQTLGNSDTLLQQNDTGLNDIVKQSINEALLEYYNSDWLSTRFAQLERERLCQLLIRWLDYEKTRPESFSVVATEQWRKLEFADLSFNVQIDRIDRLADGSEIMIDYKTGKPNISDWFDDRPLEPQLPLYCVSHGSRIDGLAFAQIRTEDLRFKGITKNSNQLPNTTAITDYDNPYSADSWTKQLKQWQDTLSELAQDFASGYAAVDPKNTTVCERCELQPFCRIHEASDV